MSEFLPPIVVPITATLRDLVTAFAAAEAATRVFADDEERILSKAGDDGGRAFGDGVTRGIRRSMSGGGGGGLGLGSILTRGLGILGSTAVPAMFTGLIFGAAQAVAALAPLLGLVNLLPAGIAALAMSLVTLKMAFKGVGTAISAGFSGDMEKYAEALSKLTPAARSAVREMVALKPALDAVKNTVQQNFFAELVGRFRALGNEYLPLVRVELGAMATALGGTFRNVIDMMTHSEFFFDDVRTTMRNVVQATRNADTALTNILKTFGTLAAVGSSFLPRMGTALSEWTQQFQSFIATAAESGDLERWIEGGITTLKMLGGLLADVWDILRPIIAALNATSSGGFGFLGTLLNQLGDFLNSAEGTQFLTDLFGILNQTFELLGHILIELLPVIARFVEMIKPLADEFLPQMWPIVDLLAQGMMDWLVSLEPLIPLIAELTRELLPLVVPLLKMFLDLTKDSEPLARPLLEQMLFMVRLIKDLVEWFGRLGPTLRTVGEWFAALPGRIGNALRALPGTLLRIGHEAMERFAYTIGFGIGNAVKTVAEMPGRVWDIIKSMASTASNLIEETIIRWVKIFQGAPGRAKSALSGLPGLIKSVFVDVLKWLEQAGRDLIQGLLNGVASMWSKSYNFVKDLGKNLIQGFRDAVGWHSPASEFVPGGASIVAGIVKGVVDNAASARRTVAGLLGGLGGGRAPGFAFAGAGGRGGLGGGMQTIQLVNRVYLDSKELHAGLIQPAQRYKIRTGTTGLS